MIWRAKMLWLAATGPTGWDATDAEPMSAGYATRLTGLLISKKIDLWTWIWALRSRPASVCGHGGSYALADWIG